MLLHNFCSPGEMVTAMLRKSYKIRFYCLQVHDQQRELSQLNRQLGKAALECEELSQTTGLKGKVVYDENDPMRPRFSLPELRDILQERNALKARVSDLEDELAVFRPRAPQQA